MNIKTLVALLLTSACTLAQTSQPTSVTPVVVAEPAIPAETALTWLIPKIGSQLTVDSQTKSNYRFITVHGTFTVSSQLQDKSGISVVAPNGTVVRVMVDDAQHGGLLPLGAVLSIDSTQWEDGTHALQIDLVDMAVGGENVSSRVINFAIDNVPNTPLPTQPQRIPVASDQYHQLTWSPRVAWWSYPGHLPFPSVSPLELPTGAPLQFALGTNPPQPLTPAMLRDSKYWVGSRLTRANYTLYRPSKHPYLSADGHVFAASHYARGDAAAEGQKPQNDRMDWWTGTPCDFSPYSTLIPNPVGAGWIGVDVSGTAFSVTRLGKGKVHFGPTNETRWEASCVACHQNPSVIPPAPQTGPILPPRYWDTKVSPTTAAQFAADKMFVGVQPTLKLNVATDIAVDPTDHDVLYVCDMLNHRIAKLDLRNAKEAFVLKGTGHGVLTTFIGGAAGYVDGPAAAARFNKPTSIVIDRGRMIIADRNNCAIRAYDFATGVVSTIAGGTLVDIAASPKKTEAQVRPRFEVQPKTTPPTFIPFYPATPCPPQSVSDWIWYPQCVRVTSNGTVLVSENLTKAIKAIDETTGLVSFVSTSPGDDVSGNNPWTWIEVDTGGLCGPVDDIFEPWISGRGNSYIGRHGFNDGYHGVLLPGKNEYWGGVQTDCPPDFPARHYAWMVSVALDGTIATTGFGSGGFGLLRRRTTTDTFMNDNSAWKHFMQMMRTGTSFNIMGVRPSFSSLHGTFGYSSFGVHSFDEVADAWMQLQDHIGGPQQVMGLAEQILQAGWDDGVARPEMTGLQAWEFAYGVLRASTRTGWQLPPKPSIAGTPPSVSPVLVTRVQGSATLTWTSTTPTLSVVRYGRGAAPIGRCWDAEQAYSTSHSVTVSGVPNATLNWWITLRDQTGRAVTVSFVQ